jgi:hypothetical protein
MSLDMFGMGGGGGTTDLQQMFEGQKISSKLLKQIFGKKQRGQVRDFAQYPYPVTGGEMAEAEFFGTAPDEELLDIFAIGKDKKRKKALRKYYKNYDYEAAAERARNSEFGRELDATTGRIEENLLPATDELLRSGFRTSIDPIVAEEKRRLMEETAPALGARYRTSLRSSGFDNATGQALEDLAIRLGTLNFNADEAAAARRTQAILSGGAGNAYQLPLNLRLGGALVQGQAGERARGRFESVRPGARLLNTLQMLSGVETSGGFVQQGQNPGGSGLGDLASIFGQSGMDLSSIFGGGGGFGSTGGAGAGSAPGMSSAASAHDAFSFDGVY